MLSRKDIIQQTVSATLTVGAATAIGVVHGRKGVMPGIGPVPVDAAAGAGALVVGGLVGGRGGMYLMDVGKGLLSYFGGSIGAQLGQRMRKNAGELTGVANSRTITAGANQPRQFAANTVVAAGNPNVVANSNQFSPEDRVRAYRQSTLGRPLGRAA